MTATCCKSPSSSAPWPAHDNTVLVVGAGAREHALAWKLLQGTRTSRVLVAPGNGGTAVMARCANVDVAVDDVAALLEVVRREAVDAVLIGPEAALVAGLADALEAAGVPCFGPTQAAAQLEGSKAYAKQFMLDAGIPTAAYAVFSDLPRALDFVQQRPFHAQGGCVVKADGLAAGKGVAVCTTLAQAQEALTQQLGQRRYGQACDRVVIEALLPGVELSVLALCDGHSVHIMPPTRDHKRLHDHDRGPNTGGMGAFSPVPGVDAALLQQVDERVFQPFLRELKRRGLRYCGVIYAGIMVHEGQIHVLEFNCRFGDPETQVLMPLLASDLLDVMQACCQGRLAQQAPRWRAQACLTVVMAAPGYPQAPIVGTRVQLPNPKAPSLAHLSARTAIFHAGTRWDQRSLTTAGGRVLSLTAWGTDLADCRQAAYALVAATHFDQAQWRTDIAHSAAGTGALS